MMQVFPEMHKIQSEKVYESDEDFQSPMLKSSLSSPSTVDSPLLSPQRCEGLDTDEEE